MRRIIYIILATLVAGLILTVPQPAQAAPSTMISKLAAGRSASMIVFGDSTGNEKHEWVYRLTQSLAKKYPKVNVRYTTWLPGQLRYPPSQLVHKGTGKGTLMVWNASAAGKYTGYHVEHFARMMPKNPDMAWISHGHNEDTALSTMTPNLDRWRTQYLALSTKIEQAAPSTRIVVVLQNPRIVPRAYDRDILLARQQIVQERGYGLLNVYRSYKRTFTWSAAWMADNTHPNATGQQKWAYWAFKWLMA